MHGKIMLLKNMENINMEQKNELSDILLHQKKNNKEKGNFLLIASAVLIIFFLGLISYKIVSSGSSKSAKLPIEAKVGPDSDDFTQMKQGNEEITIPSQEEQPKEASLDEKIKQIKKTFDKEVGQNSKDVQQNKTLPKSDKISQKPPKETLPPPQEKYTKSQELPKKKQKTSIMDMPVDTTQTKKDTVIKKKQKKDKFYIQVASFSKTPPKKTVDFISSKGYACVLRRVHTKNGDYTRLYVGPYTNKLEAASALINVNKDLGLPDAFVIRDY